METNNNELYENENLPAEQETVSDPVPAEENEQEKLYEELEQVRVLFEETLKQESEKAETGEETDGELIQPLEDIENEASEEEGSVEADQLADLISQEDEGEKRTAKIRKRGFLTCLIMAAAFFAAVFSSMTSVVDLNNPEDVSFEYFVSGFEAYSENKIVSAVNNYSKYLTEVDGKDNISMTAVRQIIDSYDRMGAYSYAADVINQFYSEKELKLPWNGKYRKIIETNELYNLTYSEIQAIIQQNVTEDGYDFEKLISEVSALKDSVGENGEKLYSDFIIDIYAFDFMTMADYDDEELYSFISEIDEKYGKQENSHITSLCRYAAITGRKDVADECFERMMNINSQNTDIYSAYFNYYRFLDTPDTEKMKEITLEMAEICGTLANECGVYNMDYLYNQAITYLLTNEGSLALESMEELYSAVNYYGSYYSGTFTTSTVNLYALAALYNGDTETYESAKAILENAGYEISGAVEKYKNGKMTIEEVLTDKGGDIA